MAPNRCSLAASTASSPACLYAAPGCLVVRDPFVAAPFRLVDELLRTAGNGKRVTGFTPALDIRETDEYRLLFDPPGVKPEAVSIEVRDQTLTVVGHPCPLDGARPATAARASVRLVRSQPDDRTDAGRETSNFCPICVE